MRNYENNSQPNSPDSEAALRPSESLMQLELTGFSVEDLKAARIKRIPLPNGKFAIVDIEDYEELFKYKWQFNKGYAVRTVYAKRGQKRSSVKMHRLVNKTPKGFETDHINGDKLDNRKCNLRTATHSENTRNRGCLSCNTSGLKGVELIKKTGKWRALIRALDKRISLGSFPTAELASEAYNNAAIKYHGQFAKY